jgi:hypothetical protein
MLSEEELAYADDLETISTTNEAHYSQSHKIMMLIAQQIIPKILYRASRASWLLPQCKKFDKIVSTAYRRILSLGHTFPEALIYLPKNMHGLDISRFSYNKIQIHKWNMFHIIGLPL